MPDVATQLEIYRRMNLTMRNGGASRKVIRTGRLIMPYYSQRGQEVIPSALFASLNDEDAICAIYRGIHTYWPKAIRSWTSEPKSWDA